MYTYTLKHKITQKQQLLLQDSDVRNMLGNQLYEEMRKSNIFSHSEKNNTITFQFVAHKNVAKNIYNVDKYRPQ